VPSTPAGLSPQQLRVIEAIADTTPDFFYAFDLNARFLYANRRLLEVWGVTAEQAFGKSLPELGYPAWHVEMHHRELKQVIDTKQPIKGEVPFTGGSGISGLYEYIFNPVLGANGEVELIIGTTRDVTDRAGLNSALAAERAKLADVIEKSPAFICMLREPNHVFELANHRYLELIGQRDSILGKPIDQALPEVRAQGFIDLLDQVYQSGESYSASSVPVQLQRDGNTFETRYLDFTYQAIRDTVNGPVTGVFVHGLDMTEHIVTRQALAEREAHMAALVESSDDAIISKSLESIIRSWNAGAERLFGYTADETIGQSILMLIPPDRQSEEAEILRRLRIGERIEHFESVRLNKSGEHIDVSLTISPVKDASGRIIGASKIARNITRQKRAERELQAAKDLADRANREKDELLLSERAARTELETANRIKDEFLATLSHELRTPLNAVLGWSQLLTHTALPPDAAEGIQIIERNARAQAQIIDDLLDMSRIISGKIRLDVERLELSTVITAAIETVRTAADAKGVRLLATIDSTAGLVSGDANRLQQVFWNLLTNAVKFTPRGGRVQVVLERVHSQVQVSVIDTGEGIDPVFLPHVFDRFRQADAGTTRRHGGLGLGLAIVKQLVELHGGSIKVKSAGVGAGSTFTVTLPLSPLQPPPDFAKQPGASTRTSIALSSDVSDRLAGIKVLVVDDEPDARNLIKRLFEERDAVVTTAASADEAVQLVRSERPNVLISDIGMPGEDGYALIRRVRKLPKDQGRDTPALALTAYARAEDRMKAVMAGFQQHVVKPVEPAELLTLVSILAQPAN
jgi:PAS domain S-box-containing protein